jgi:acetyl esterase
MPKPFMRADVAAFLDVGAAAGTPPINALPVAMAREAIREAGRTGDIDPVSLAVVRDLTCPGPGGPIGLRFYDRRPVRDQGLLILYFHGGGFVFGDLESHDSFCRTLADLCDLPVLAVDYRLAPEHPFPAFVDDAEAVARWVAGQPVGLGLAITGMVTCGDSAGGHLAVMVAQRLGQVPGKVPVLAQWALYPFLGGGYDWDSMHAFADGYMLSSAVMQWFDDLCGNPYGEPRYTLALAPIPQTPLLMLTAGLDPLRDQGLAYADKAKAAGAQVVHMEAEGMIHGFANMRRALPSAVQDVDNFLRVGLALIL